MTLLTVNPPHLLTTYGEFAIYGEKYLDQISIILPWKNNLINIFQAVKRILGQSARIGALFAFLIERY
jgi:hypothetical protein